MTDYPATPLGNLSHMIDQVFGGKPEPQDDGEPTDVELDQNTEPYDWAQGGGHDD